MQIEQDFLLLLLFLVRVRIHLILLQKILHYGFSYRCYLKSSEIYVVRLAGVGCKQQE